MSSPISCRYPGRRSVEGLRVGDVGGGTCCGAGSALRDPATAEADRRGGTEDRGDRAEDDKW